MAKLGMFLRQFDPFLLPSIVLGHLRHSDGSGTWPFFVDDTDAWPKSKIIALLKQNGIDSWGWGASVTNDWHFTVRRGQAEWAEYLMLRAGVPVRGRLLTEGGASAHGASSRPNNAPHASDVRLNQEGEATPRNRQHEGSHDLQFTSSPTGYATREVNNVVQEVNRFVGQARPLEPLVGS